MPQERSLCTSSFLSPLFFLTTTHIRCSAPPRYNLNTRLIQRPTSPCLPNELYLPPVLALLLLPHHNNDHKCSISQNPQLTLEPSRLSPSSRLGLPPSTNSYSSRHRWPGRESTRSSNPQQPRQSTVEHQHQRSQ